MVSAASAMTMADQLLGEMAAKGFTGSAPQRRSALPSELEKYMLELQIEEEKKQRNKILLNPMLSGYTEKQLVDALDFAFGKKDLYGVAGGVGIQNLNLYGLGPLSTESMLKDQFILQEVDRISQGAFALAGPTSLASSLMQQAIQAAFSQQQNQGLQAILNLLK